MSKSRSFTFLVALLAGTQTGCGTMHNLAAPPVAEPVGMSLPMGPGACIPFGGVARSGLLGMAGPQLGVYFAWEGQRDLFYGDNAKEGIAKIGNGMLLTGAGLVSIVDTPLSLAGDIVTLPIAYARQQQYSWATWWGADPSARGLHGALFPMPYDSPARPPATDTDSGVGPARVER